jgi:hypothetical protein
MLFMLHMYQCARRMPQRHETRASDAAPPPRNERPGTKCVFFSLLLRRREPMLTCVRLPSANWDVAKAEPSPLSQVDSRPTNA